MLVKSMLSAQDLKNEFKKMNRDNFSIKGYQTIIDLFNECEDALELDVIAIDCDFVESGVEEIKDDYDLNGDTIEEILVELNDKTIAYQTGEETILYQNF